MPPTPVTATRTVTVTCLKDKDCKHSIRYAEQVPPNGEPAIGTIYIKRAAAGNAQAVRVSLEFPA